MARFARMDLLQSQGFLFIYLVLWQHCQVTALRLNDLHYEGFNGTLEKEDTIDSLHVGRQTTFVNSSLADISALVANVGSESALTVGQLTVGQLQRQVENTLAIAKIEPVTATIITLAVLHHISVHAVVGTAAVAGGGIAAGVIVAWILVALGASATITFGGMKLYSALTKEAGFTNMTLCNVLDEAVRFGTILISNSSDFGALATEAHQDGYQLQPSTVNTTDYYDDNFTGGNLTSFVFVPPDDKHKQQFLLQLSVLAASCGRSVKPKGLGASASSSRSGAMFWKCARPAAENGDDTSNFPRTLIKGGIRGTSSSPEWQAFMKMSARLGGRFSDDEFPTLLNKVPFGFDAFGVHWLALEDIGVERAIKGLQRVGVRPAFSWDDIEEDSIQFYDVKPLPSRAPQMPDLLLHLKAVEEHTGVPLSDFVGWNEIRKALVVDLDFLKSDNVIDESLVVQVVGPLDVEFDGSEPPHEVLKAYLLQSTPRCVYHMTASTSVSDTLGPGEWPTLVGDVTSASMTIVCITVLDYFLTLSFAKGVQNLLQASRWDDYGGKMLSMFDCIGSTQHSPVGGLCDTYAQVATRGWSKIWQDEFEKNDALRQATGKIEQDYRCCCDLQETRWFTPKTPCRWDKYGETASRWTGCPGFLWHVKPEKGGCADVDPPQIAVAPACGVDEVCCCDFTGLTETTGGMKVSGFRKKLLNTVFYKEAGGMLSINGPSERPHGESDELQDVPDDYIDVLLEVQNDICKNMLVVSYGDTSETGPSGSFWFEQGLWRSKVLFRKTMANGCVKTYTAKCGHGGIDVTEKCGEKTKSDTRCLGGFLCFAGSRKSDINEGEEVELYDPKHGTVKLTAGLVQMRSMDAPKGAELLSLSAEGQVWWSADKTLATYRCGGKWYIQKARVMERAESCSGMAHTNALDWTDPSAVWWEGNAESFPSIRADLSAADVVVPMGRCGCQSGGTTCSAPQETEMPSDIARAAYCPAHLPPLSG